MYAVEHFTAEESDILRRYFTNLDQPVFALVNLPEVVKGALFARYSRSHSSLRRLFLEEFVDDLDVTGDLGVDATIGMRRAEELYQRVFYEYGDDSVAQLGGVHLACEQASNVLTKVLEWGRLMSYLEQSTRYLSYDYRIDGRFRFYRDPEILGSALGARYVGDMDRMFEAYAAVLPRLQDHFRQQLPQAAGVSDFAHRQAIRAKAFDAARGMLPAASLSNVGIYGTGQGYEALLLRMRSHPMPEARDYAAMMLHELRKVIPSFLRRVDVPDRGGEWSDYLATNRSAMERCSAALFAGTEPQHVDPVTLVDWDPAGEEKMLAAMLYPYADLPEHQIRQRVAAMTVGERVELVRAYAGDRTNRRHKPGRALERIGYRFDVLSDYGAFRDLQRHRLLTVEWQDLAPHHGFVRPESIESARVQHLFDDTMQRSADLYDVLVGAYPRQAPYAVSMAYRIRYAMQFNAREAMHLIELRSSPQGHPSYRRLVQDMHRAIRDQAGHAAVAEMFRFVDLSDGEDGRLAAEIRSDARRDALT